MKHLFALCLLFAGAAANAAAQTSTAPAFPFTYYIHDTTGINADTPLPSIYQFAATPVGSNSNIVIKGVNTSATPAYLGDAFVTATSTSAVANPNYTVTGLALDLAVPVGGSFVFTVNFSPTVAGPITAYLQTSYQVQTTGCDFTSNTAAEQCPSGLNVSATLTGTATQPQLVLSYQSTSGSTILQPGASSPLNFGSVAVGTPGAKTFTLANESNLTLTVPPISITPPTVYTPSAFALDISQVPATLATGTSANFTVTYEPGQSETDSGVLVVGSNSYTLQGEGISALQITYVDITGVQIQPQVATAIPFGQVVAGTGGSDVLTFTVALNPSTSNQSLVASVPAISVTGTGFTLGTVTSSASGATTVFPASVTATNSLTFQVTFTPTAANTYSGTLNIGALQFPLSGSSINSPLPSFTLSVTPAPLTSQQQATIAVQLSGASPLAVTGTIALTFVPSVTNVTDDPAIMFMATSGRTLSLSVASGSEFATYNGQSALTFQTGSTAGTLTFTVNFPDTPTFTQSYTITPTLAQITSATAVRASPNLVVTLAGYDNTYSASQLNFTFYDTSGKEIAPIAVNAASDFQQLFFNNNTGGGAFSFQATFPVTGDVTQVGSVSYTVNNSAGTTSSTQNFQ